jgi:hypothetical protein
VSRRKKSSKPSPQTARERLKALPWALLLQATVVIGKRWRALPEKDRARVARIVRESRGRPSSLGTRERLELRRVMGKLDVKRMIRELVPLVRGGGSRRKRR